MSVTESIKDYIKNAVNGGDHFDYWLNYNVDHHFGEAFVSTLETEKLWQEGEELREAIENAVDLALCDLAQAFEDDMDMIAHEAADADQRVIYTGQYVDYFTRNSRCEEICEEQGLTSTPEDPYSHMQAAVYYALQEEISSELQDNLAALESIDASDVEKAIEI